MSTFVTEAQRHGRVDGNPRTPGTGVWLDRDRREEPFRGVIGWREPFDQHVLDACRAAVSSSTIA